MCWFLLGWRSGAYHFGSLLPWHWLLASFLGFSCLEHISYITANFPRMCLMLDQFLWGHSSRDCVISCFKINIFQKNLSKTLSECQTVWIQIRTDILLVLIWVQTVCNSCQQMTLVVPRSQILASWIYLFILSTFACPHLYFSPTKPLCFSNTHLCLLKVNVPKFQTPVACQKGPRHTGQTQIWRSSLIRVFPICYSDRHFFFNSSIDNQHFIWKQSEKKCLKF